MPDREPVEPDPRDKRYVRRDVGRSSAQDQKREAKNPSERGQGDKGDRKS